ncbi:DUF371 domain-containing protein [[Eubacterium] cellulosolvens]
MKIEEYFEAYGDKNIRATHHTSFEFTTDNYLTRKGDCILGIRATKSPLDLTEDFKSLARRKNSKIYVDIEVDGIIETAIGYGNPSLIYTHPRDMVFRKSTYTCERTIMIKSSKAAIDFSRQIIQILKNPDQKIEIALSIEK